MPSIVRPPTQAVPQLVRNTTRLSASAATLRPSIIKAANTPALAGPRSVQRVGVMFAPFATLDAFKMAIAENGPRIMRGKNCRALISANLQQHQAFLRHRAAYAELCSAKLHQTNLDLLKGIGPKSKRDAAGFYVDAKLRQLQRNRNQLKLMRQTLRTMVIRPNIQNKDLASLRPQLHKLYILGHGIAGQDSLSSQDANHEYTRVTAAQLSSLLKTSGLPANFRDIRVISCHSADATRLQSFEPKVLAHNHRPCTVKRGANTQLLIPFAQRLTQALHQAGFKAQAVTGYHGLGFAPAYTSPHHHRILPMDKEVQVRSSTVRHRFLPELTPVPPPPPKASQS